MQSTLRSVSSLLAKGGREGVHGTTSTQVVCPYDQERSQAQGDRINFLLTISGMADPKGSDAVVMMTVEEAWAEERKRRVQWPAWPEDEPEEEPAEDLRGHLAGLFDRRYEAVWRFEKTQRRP